MATQNMVSTLFDAKLDVRSAFLPRRGALYLAVLQGTRRNHLIGDGWRRWRRLAWQEWSAIKQRWLKLSSRVRGSHFNGLYGETTTNCKPGEGVERANLVSPKLQQ